MYYSEGEQLVEAGLGCISCSSIEIDSVPALARRLATTPTHQPTSPPAPPAPPATSITTSSILVANNHGRLLVVQFVEATSLYSDGSTRSFPSAQHQSSEQT